MPRSDARVSRAADSAAEARTAPECPFCHAREAELLSLFGTHAMLLQYRCTGCGSIYEASKYVDDKEASSPLDGPLDGEVSPRSGDGGDIGASEE